MGRKDRIAPLFLEIFHYYESFTIINLDFSWESEKQDRMTVFTVF